MTLADDWHARWGVLGVRPISHELRTTARATWIRFHSLPESKRYADSEAETLEILRRQNAVLDMLVGESARPDVLAFTDMHPAADYAYFTPAMSVEVEPDTWTHLAAQALVWDTGALDPLLRLHADDTTEGAIIAPVDLAWLFAPYDGGFDVIAATPDQRDRLRARFGAWCSPHRNGL